MQMKTERTLATAFLTLATLILVGVSWVTSGRSLNEDRLIVWFFDVGQGDAAFIESPTGTQMLIDGGPGNVLLEKVSAVMPIWDRTIDAILVSHPHADHIGGFVELVDRYEVDTVYTSGVDYATPITSEFGERISDNEEIVFIERPMIIDLGGGAMLEILAPRASWKGARFDDVNEASIVALLTYGDTSILFTGDMSKEQEAEIMEYIGDIDVLKVAHHGSFSSSSTQFLKDVTSEYAIISVGADNSYGLPHPSIIERLNTIGARIFRTDQDGDIRLISTGSEPILSVYSL